MAKNFKKGISPKLLFAIHILGGFEEDVKQPKFVGLTPVSDCENSAAVNTQNGQASALKV
ncbi:hypothetical protein OAF56_01235 [Pirellulaceae bacterium]|nr:hypothetical protein [Pirellulaceae bacterium]